MTAEILVNGQVKRYKYLKLCNMKNSVIGEVGGGLIGNNVNYFFVKKIDEKRK